jgi:phasin family protein
MFKFDASEMYGKDAMDSVLKSYSSAAKGFQAIATETADFSKKSFEAGVAHMEKLMAVKSVEAAVELQTAFAKSAFESYVAEMSKLGEMYADLAKDAYKPIEGSVAKATEVMKATVEQATSAAA